MFGNDSTEGSGIDVASIVEEYERRAMAEWSDITLARAVADVVQQSRAGAFDSFVLHAPLETAARSALLAHVTSPVRWMSRLRMVSIAARYEAFGPAATTSGAEPVHDPVEAFIEAIRAGDSDNAEAAAHAIASTHDRAGMISALADFVIPLTSAAAHTPIFFHLLQRSDPRGPITTTLLAPLARELARDTGKAIRWIDDHTGTFPTDAAALHRQLLHTPSQAVDSAFIDPIMDAVDSSGLARRQLDGTVGRFDREAASAVLRVAAMSMIHDTPEHAPYGWTHCLTLPQAVLEIAPMSQRPDIALAVAATHVVGFRAAIGETSLPEQPVDSYASVDIAEIIDAAATHHDAHVAKYTLACLDAAAFDPEGRHLYHNAAAHLLSVWRDRTIEDDPLDTVDDRS